MLKKINGGLNERNAKQVKGGPSPELPIKRPANFESRN